MGSAEDDVYSMPVEPERSPRPPRPAAVSVSALLFVVVGVLQLNEWLRAIADGAVLVDLSILALPLGIALYRGRAWAWRLARFALLACMVLSFVVVAALLRPGGVAVVEWGDQQIEGPPAVWIGLPLITAFVALQWGLYRWLGGRTARDLFTTARRGAKGLCQRPHEAA